MTDINKAHFELHKSLDDYVKAQDRCNKAQVKANESVFDYLKIINDRVTSIEDRLDEIDKKFEYSKNLMGSIVENIKINAEFHAQVEKTTQSISRALKKSKDVQEVLVKRINDIDKS